MSVQVVETYVVWVGKTDRIASFRKVEGYEDMFYPPVDAVSMYLISATNAAISSLLSTPFCLRVTLKSYLRC